MKAVRTKLYSNSNQTIDITKYRNLNIFNASINVKT